MREVDGLPRQMSTPSSFSLLAIDEDMAAEMPMIAISSPASTTMSGG
jgi:hypothetical protein